MCRFAVGAVDCRCSYVPPLCYKLVCRRRRCSCTVVPFASGAGSLTAGCWCLRPSIRRRALRLAVSCCHNTSLDAIVSSAPCSVPRAACIVPHAPCHVVHIRTPPRAGGCWLDGHPVPAVNCTYVVVLCCSRQRRSCGCRGSVLVCGSVRDAKVGRVTSEVR